MKSTAGILAFEGKEMRTAADISAASEALMEDLLTGEITTAEHKIIQGELTDRIKTIGLALKLANNALALKEIIAKQQSLDARVKRSSKE